VVFGLTIFSLVVTVVDFIVGFLFRIFVQNFAFHAVFRVVLPVTVLIINVAVVREMRRKSSDAASNLGRQQHQQSSPLSSAVPTVMLVSW